MCPAFLEQYALASILNNSLGLGFFCSVCLFFSQTAFERGGIFHAQEKGFCLLIPISVTEWTSTQSIVVK